jgi:hypothetical protein
MYEDYADHYIQLFAVREYADPKPISVMAGLAWSIATQALRLLNTTID